MPVIKIVDRDARGHKRKSKLWQCFGEIHINLTPIKDGKGCYYSIIRQDKIEDIINESKNKFRREGFEIHTTLAYNALRTIIIRNIDSMIADYSDQEIIDKIQNANTWAKVDSIYRLARSGQILKVKFTAIEMANKAIRDGIIVLYQKISSIYIEKETFIKLVPCYNCFGYDHKTKECTKLKQTLCSFCASKDHN